jgi:hypothetical protein
MAVSSRMVTVRHQWPARQKSVQLRADELLAGHVDQRQRHQRSTGGQICAWDQRQQTAAADSHQRQQRFRENTDASGVCASFQVGYGRFMEPGHMAREKTRVML